MSKEVKLYIVRALCIYVLVAGGYYLKMGEPVTDDLKKVAVVISLALSGLDSWYRKRRLDKKNGETK